MFPDYAAELEDYMKDQIDSMECWFNENVSGSGFNDDWTVQRADSGKIHASSSFQVLDEGSYVGWINFIIRFDLDNPTEFQLNFLDSESRRLNKKYEMRDYIEEVIMFAMEREEVCSSS